MHPARYYDINIKESDIERSCLDYLLLLRCIWRIFDALILSSKISNVNRFRVRNSNGSVFDRVFSVTKQFRVEIQSFSLARIVSAVSHY